ncbi:MAG: hypothetical protein AAGA48_26565 [Myxococcota bacterium]
MKVRLIPVVPLSLTFSAGCGDPPGPLEGVWAFVDVGEDEYASRYNTNERETEDGCLLRTDHRVAFDGDGFSFVFSFLTGVCEDGTYSYATGLGLRERYTAVSQTTFDVRFPNYRNGLCVRSDDLLTCSIPLYGEGTLDLQFRRLGASRANPPWER